VINFRYPSVIEKQKISAFRVEPAGISSRDVRGVVQIAHGMSEYARRYLPFAQFLADNGFVVVANDHLGHGKTAGESINYGYFGMLRTENLLVEDMRTLHELTRELYPDAPYFMLGHSMGSFLLREYLTIYGDELSGAIIMGTGDPSSTLASFGFGLARLTEALRGEKYRSPMLRKLVMGKYNNRIKRAQSDFDWLSTDPAVVAAYNDDKATGFTFTTNGYEHMFANLVFATSDKAIAEIPKDMPILVISGAEDPVGGYGDQVRSFTKRLEKAGVQDVTMVLYPGMRHEVLNEHDKQQVYEEILRWLEERDSAK